MIRERKPLFCLRCGGAHMTKDCDAEGLEDSGVESPSVLETPSHNGPYRGPAKVRTLPGGVMGDKTDAPKFLRGTSPNRGLEKINRLKKANALAKRTKIGTRDRRRIEQKMDQMARELVFRRDKYRCVRCRKTTGLQWAHVYTRSIKSLRWVEENAMTLCGGCHLWWHHEPIAAATWWKEKYPSRDIQLRAMRTSHQRIDIRGIQVYLEQKLATPSP